MKLYTKFITALIIFILAFSACTKDSPYKDFPDVYINIDNIYPNSTIYGDLQFTGGSEYITAPYPSKGIIVFRKSENEFKAYERTCPYDPRSDCNLIEALPFASTAVDSCCMTEYLLLNGEAFRGPGQYPLKEYNTSYDGYTLRIYN